MPTEPTIEPYLSLQELKTRFRQATSPTEARHSYLVIS